MVMLLLYKNHGGQTSPEASKVNSKTDTSKPAINEQELISQCQLMRANIR